MVIPRSCASTVLELATTYPVVAITGPRQSGKTTLVRHLFPDTPYVSLEDLDQREFARSDPRRFLAAYPDGALLDEVQRAPELFSYLQTLVDDDSRPGRFILTGSQQFGLMAGITQSLAGRVALLALLPFSLGELQAVERAPSSLEDLLFQGLYPPIHDRGHDPHRWYGNYIQTYVERDVRQLVNVQDLSTFHRFLALCAGRIGQLLNLSALAADCGISHNTARSWISVLEASYIVHLLPPFFSNLSKRLIKTPKLYFHDTGLAAWLLRIDRPEVLRHHAQRGALFESWAVSELLKARFNRGLASNLFFWRDRGGHEVDVLLEKASELVPVEIKSGQTLGRDFFRSLERWYPIVGERAGRGWLVYGGDRRQSREPAEVVPWQAISELTRAME